MPKGPKHLRTYRGGNSKGLFVLLSRTQAGPGRTVKQEQEKISRNHVQTFISPSVVGWRRSSFFHVDVDHGTTLVSYSSTTNTIRHRLDKLHCH